MALIAYDSTDAAAFEATRHLRDDALCSWRAAITQYVDPRPGMRVLDLGSGTGSWARAFQAWWPDAEIVAVEPSPAMRERTVFQPVIPGDATKIPADDASLDMAWLSTVVHHIPDLQAAARELRRVLKPGAPVLFRSVFAGRYEAITLCRFFPETTAVLDRYPSVADVEAAFATAGFTSAGVEPVPQVTASSLRESAGSLRREAHTPLQLISDEAYARGLERLRKAALRETGPVVDALDLLVLR